MSKKQPTTYSLYHKYKLEIPEEILRWVHPELKKRQGEIGDKWDDELFKLGWLIPAETEQLAAEKWVKEKYIPSDGEWNDTLWTCDDLTRAHMDGQRHIKENTSNFFEMFEKYIKNDGVILVDLVETYKQMEPK
jgi:hypothetical protein